MFGSIDVESFPYQSGLRPLETMPTPFTTGNRIYRFGQCRVCVTRREILVGDEVRQLQPQPFDLLVYLIEHRERVVRTDELLERLWAHEFVQPGTVASTVARVRKAIADGGDMEVIRTYHRVGYRFVAPLLLG